MTISFGKLFQPVALTTSIAAVFGVPSSPSTSLLRNGRVRLNNTSASAVAVYLYAVPTGLGAGAANAFVSNYSIAAYSAYEVDVPQLQAGDILSGSAGTGGVVNIHAMDGVLQS